MEEEEEGIHTDRVEKRYTDTVERRWIEKERAEKRREGEQ
jgi:hypothetical protein